MVSIRRRELDFDTKDLSTHERMVQHMKDERRVTT